MKPDIQLQKDVMEELKWDPSIKANEIGVEVKDGIVTLAGHVDNYVQKWAAETAAQRVTGVKGVAVEIDVVLPGSHTRTDAEIVEAASHALEWHTSVPEHAIKILVDNGWVTLSGKVDWAYQRDAAVGAVRNLVGVRGVNNQITLKQHPHQPDVKRQIEAALHRRAQVDAKSISILVDGDCVILNGVVDSISERNIARDAAWATPGVQTVIDNLSVGY